ncbi:type VII secretion integral membrane protein EccD [Actinomycetospora sp. CA-053990]|uniref:type VII secretion integral membrane protein EccD n=1 Tax=Actinomycetospora sp. CA-053990 TaxID=3239891 RepID=UPI003D90402A
MTDTARPGRALPGAAGNGARASLPAGSAAPITAASRVSVLAPRTRVDVALPPDVPLADLLPVLLDMTGESGAGARGGAWTLALLGQGPVDPSRTLASLGVLDGDQLVLRRRADAAPPPLFDDVVDAVAEATPASYRAWGPGLAGVLGICGLALGLAGAVLALVVAGRGPGTAGGWAPPRWPGSPPSGSSLRPRCARGSPTARPPGRSSPPGPWPSRGWRVSPRCRGEPSVLPPRSPRRPGPRSCCSARSSPGRSPPPRSSRWDGRGAPASPPCSAPSPRRCSSPSPPASPPWSTRATPRASPPAPARSPSSPPPCSRAPGSPSPASPAPRPGVGRGARRRPRRRRARRHRTARRPRPRRPLRPGPRMRRRHRGRRHRARARVGGRLAGVAGWVLAVLLTLLLALRSRTYANGVQAVALLVCALLAGAGLVVGWLLVAPPAVAMLAVPAVALAAGAGAFVLGVVVPRRRFSPVARRAVDIAEAVGIAAVLPVALAVMDLYTAMRLL